MGNRLLLRVRGAWRNKERHPEHLKYIEISMEIGIAISIEIGIEIGIEIVVSPYEHPLFN